MGKQEDLERAGMLLRAAQAIAESDPVQALERFRVAADHCREVGLTGAEVDARLGLARCLQETRDLVAATREYEVARSLAEVLGDRVRQSVAVGFLAPLYKAQGRWDDALDAARLSGEFAKASGDTRGQLVARGIAGQVFRRMGRLDEALSEAMDGLALAQEAGDVPEELAFLGDLVAISMAKADDEEAARLALRGLERCEALDRDRGQAVFHGHLGQLARRAGDLDGALDHANQGLEAARRAGDRHEEAAFVQDLALVKEARGDMGGAIEELRASLDILEELGQRESLVVGYRRLGLMLCQVNEHVRAMAAIAHALVLSAPVAASLYQDTFSGVFPVVAQAWIAGEDDALLEGLGMIDQALTLAKGDGSGEGPSPPMAAATPEVSLAMEKAVAAIESMARSRGDAGTPESAEARRLGEEVDAVLGTDLVGYLAEAYRKRNS
jgi:tetratricopeptide (TPR) repeat protein